MTKSICKIGCMPKEDASSKTLQSMIKILTHSSMSSQLHWQWIYSENDAKICLIDFDHYAEFDEHHQPSIFLSNQPERLTAYKYTLKRPLRFQELLQVLKEIEKNEPELSEQQEVALETNIDIVEEGIIDTAYKLLFYPDFSQTPADLMFSISRVCALLAAKASTLNEAAHFLDMTVDEVRKTIDIIKNASYSDYATIAEEQITISSTHEQKPQHKASSFWVKIWKKLKGEA